ncbi:MAG: carboxypeptidase-like regulatory domain-containing protein [Bacteroidota bacterium]
MLYSLLTVFILLFIDISTLYAQEGNRQIIKGKVLDFETGDPVAYSTISCGKESTFSNTDGDFIFKLPPGLDSLIISHIGYRSLYIAVSSLNSYQNDYFRLHSDTLKLAEIIIQSKKIKENAKDIVKQASARIESNLLQDFGADAFYRQIHYFNNVVENKYQYLRLLEAGIRLNYNGQNLSSEIFEIRSSDDMRFAKNFKLNSKSKKRENESNGHRLENFLKLDYLRFKDVNFHEFKFSEEVIGLGSLNDKFIERHKFKLDTIISNNGNWVYVIKVLPSKKSVDLLSRIKKFMVIPIGKLYIRGSDYAVLQMEYSYIINPEKTKSNFSYAVTQMMIGGRIVFSDKLLYSNYNGKTYLSSIRRDIYDTQALGGNNVAIYRNLGGRESMNKEADGFFRVSKELIINNVYITPQSSVFHNRESQYQNLTPLTHTYNRSFWRNFNSTKSTEKETKLIRDLEVNRSLEEQFEDNNKSY